MGFESKQINRKNSDTYLFLEMFFWVEQKKTPKNVVECFLEKFQTLRLLH